MPSLQRISTYTVSEWREESFTICKTITADTPVEYFEAGDLPIAPVTGAMTQRRYTVRRAGAATAAIAADQPTETPSLTFLLLFPGTDRENGIAARLRALGHTVHAFDTAISPALDLSVESNRTKVTLNGGIQKFS